MRYLVNCTNLKKGGGLQVADSICKELYKYDDHFFLVVLSTYMDETKETIGHNKNVNVFVYNIKNNPSTILFGRDKFLDSLVADYKIDAVLTIFGPSRWNPKCKHLSGFARAQLVLSDSPYYLKMPLIRRIRELLNNQLLKLFFIRSGKYFWTENRYISEKLSLLFPHKYQVFTITNYYNQIYDRPDLYKRTDNIEKYDGITCLSLSTYKDYKNFEIIPQVLDELKKSHPEFRVRFILTLDKCELEIPTKYEDAVVFVGKADIAYCPYLYQMSDIMFMPTLLECFTASYPEAMRMEVPIVTTDLEFAHELCGAAACYFSALDAKSAADAIYKVATDKDFTWNLIQNGSKQLKKYDNYEQRAEKLIRILETITRN